MAWTETSAIANLRTRLSDQATDKYVHQSLVDPEPNGVDTEFAVPDTNLIGIVTVYIDGQAITALPDLDLEEDPPQDEYLDRVAGRIVIAAPDEGQKLRVSYYFQWFTDSDLQAFLTQASQLLGFESVEDGALTVQLRTPLLSFAAHYAYLKMAANSAQAVSTAAAGFEGDNTKEHPYWMDLAKEAWDTAQKELETASTNPASSIKPHMRFVAYALSRYVPRT